MKERDCEKRAFGAAELALKLTLSGAAIGFFGAVGVLVAGLSPEWLFARGFHARPEVRQVRSARSPRVGAVPAPADGELTFRSAGPGGGHWRYESALSEDELRRFYVRSLRQRGWQTDGTFEETGVTLSPLPDERRAPCVLSFNRGARTCIIAIEEKSWNRTVVSVLVF